MKCVGLLVLAISIQLLLPRRDDAGNSDEVTIPKSHRNSVKISLSDIGGNLLESYSSFHTTLHGLKDCDSTTLSSASGDLLAMHEVFPTIKRSSFNTLSTLKDALPDAFSAITQVVTKLNIGTSAINAIEKIQTHLTEVLKIVDGNEFSVTELDSAVMFGLLSITVVVNTVSYISEASSTKLGLIPTETQETLLSFTLVLHSTLIIAQNVFTSLASVVTSSASEDSSTLNLVLLALDRVLQGVTKATTLITSSIISNMLLVIGNLSVILTSLTARFNESLGKIEAGIVLETTDHLQVVVDNLSDVIGNLTRSVTPAVKAISIALTSVASSNSGIQSKVATQLYPLFKTILQFSGSDLEIVEQFNSTLSSIFDTVTVSLGRLMYGISNDLTLALIEAMKNIQLPLSQLLSLISNKNFKKLKANEKQVDGVIKELGKCVQIFGSIAVAITSAIYESIDSFSDIVLEAAVALQFIHTAVIYVVQWVNALGASIFKSTVGSANDMLSKLSVFMLAMFQLLAKISGIISDSLYESHFKTISSIMPYLNDLGTKVIDALSAVSLVNTNTTVTVDQLTSNTIGMVPGSIEDIVSAGSVSQILTGLSGSLGSYSSTLSSSLSSFTNSLNRIVSSNSETLKVIGSGLISVVTKISEITGSASQILNSTSRSLISIFAELLVIISKLTVLSDLSVSLSGYVSKISISIYSLIDAVNDCNGTFYIIDDPIKSVAKNVQILISTFSAIITAAADASEEIRNTVADTILGISYVVCTIILAVQQGLSAVIASLAVSFDSIPIFVEKLIFSIAEILESITSIAAKTAVFVNEFSNNFSFIIIDMKSSVTNLNNMTSSSLSTISGIVANMQVSLAVNQKA